MRSLLSFCVALLPLMQACTDVPLQQDVTGLKTTQIVDHVKCEAQLALESKIISLLQYHRSGGTNPPWSMHLANSLEKDPEKFHRLSKLDLEDDDARKFYDEYIRMAIAFNFTFDVTDDVSAGTTIDLLKPFSGGRVSLALTASGDRKRSSMRNFVVGNTFGELLQMHLADCGPGSIEPNFAYPISGSIGLRELVDTFVDLNVDAKLSPTPGEKTKIFAETLMFTTTLSASTTPKVALDQSGRGFQIIDASVVGSASRTDMHQVIIGLSLPGESVSGKTGGNAIRRLPTAVPFSGYPTIGEGDAKQAAIAATNQQRFNTFLDRFGTTILSP